MNPASGMVSSSRPGSNSAELTDTEDANPGTSAQLRSSPQESPEETPHETVSPDTMQNAGISVGQNDGAILNEVRVSLHRISDGVKELATTFEDLLGLSDAESNESDDYDYDSDGGRHLSWAKLKSRARRRRRLRRQRKNAWGGNQPPSAKDDVESNDDGLKKGPQIIPQIKECDFKQFQSLTAVDGERLHCIDILIAGHSLDKDIEKFEEIVSKINSGRIVSWEPDQTEESTSEGNDEKWIRRIRINSRAVAELLRQICPQIKGFRNRPVVFHRPFQLLVSLHEKVKEELAKMKGLASGNFNDLSPKDSGNPVDLSIAKTLEQETPILRGNKDSLDELTCFVDFMESRIMPDYRRYRDPSSKPPRTIRWEDMWYLFKPGDLVYCPQDFSQRFLRVIHTNLTPTSPNIPALGMAERNWSFLCHFIEYDGASYAPVHVCFPPILPFQGEKKVTELPLYPTSYLEDDLILGRAQSDGSTYVNLIERRSGFYSGWTQTRDFAGRPLPGYFPDDRDVIPEHVESDILVDFQETFNALPHWKPVFYLTVVGNHKPDDYGFLPEQSDQPILESDEIGRTMQGHFDQDLSSDDTEIIEAVKFLADDPFGQFKAETRTAPTGKFLALLSRRFFAYAVLARKFVQLDTRFVRSAELESSGKAFEKLEINRDYKRLISSLVKSHFEKMDIERKTNVEIDTQDLIRGKGNGLLILLHGAPGVGKTLTAEAVALKWKKPLFPITSGDLGFTAEELEKSLNQIFRIAQHWGCIVLLDEADIFITQRDRGDLRRNALVSVFLRVLEYYNGIMFLTTNRAGVLDEAIKSRVHLNLHYDHLTEEQTVAIFKQHIQRLRDIEKQRNPDPNEQIWIDRKEIIEFARDHFNQHDKSHGSGSSLGRWNGRQIRNAFLIASSLVHYDSEDDGNDEDKDELEEPSTKKQKQLGKSQFEIVAKTTLLYDQYRALIHSGKSDDHVAFEREERAMSYQPRSLTPDRMNSTRKRLS